MVRGPFYDKNGVKKGAWSKEEDECLSDYIHKHGHSNWRQLPKLAGLTRCGKSCRLRWLNYLKPNLKHGNYTREEDEMIIKLHHHFGNKWSLIAEKMPGRTDHEIKNYWHSYLKKCLKSNENTMLDLKLKPCDNVEENDTHHYVAPKSPISNVGKDFLYILESSTLPMLAAETSPEDNYSPGSILPMLASETSPEDNYSPSSTLPMLTTEISPEDNYLSGSILPMLVSETSPEDNYSPSSTLPMLATETSPEDNYSSDSILPMLAAETSPKDNYSPSSMHSRIIEEDNVAQWLTFESFSGDFWTEPFIIEDTYTTNEISNEDIDLLISDFYDGSYVF